MIRRHTLAHALGVSALFAAGCFGSHGLEREPRPEPLPDDAGTPPMVRDAAPMPIPVPPPPSSCGSLAGLTITTETIGLRPCGPGVYEGSALYGREPVPGGLRLLIDTCPDADDDCRCNVTVTGLHDGIDAEIATSGRAVTVHLAESGVLIEQPPSGDCPADDFACVNALVFAAMDGSLDTPPIDADALDVYFGEPTCSGDAPERGPDCSSIGYELRIIAWVSGFPGAIGTEYTALEGDTLHTPETGTTIRAIRTNVRSCPDERVARTAAWAAWASAP